MENWIIELLIILLIAVAIALLMRKYLFFVTQVSSHSMTPTFQTNDRLLTLRIYHSDKLKRGDIIVFYSNEKRMLMIKRLIGLPGDSVQISDDGRLLINGNKGEEPYIKNREGKSRIFSVPKDEYFLLGDNRDSSNDSRHWVNATIPGKDIQGKVIFSLWPFRKV